MESCTMVGAIFQLADDLTLCSPSWLRSSSAAHTHTHTHTHKETTIVHRHRHRKERGGIKLYHWYQTSCTHLEVSFIPRLLFSTYIVSGLRD